MWLTVRNDADDPPGHNHGVGGSGADDGPGPPLSRTG
jgi:hypothetical protein